jgi:hypothetical protein
MAAPTGVALLDHFAALPDPRQHAKILYPLPEILLLVLSATLAGADDFVETTLWGTQHLAFLRRFYRYESGIPSHDTLCDVFAALDPELFKACFLAWTSGLRDACPWALVPRDDADIIAIDSLPRRKPAPDLIRGPGGRPRGAATTGGRAATRCISSPPGRHVSGSCSDSRRPRRNPTRSPLFPCC